MATFTDTFERKELKYRLSGAQQQRVIDALAGRMAPDMYGNSLVTSLYFDTPTRALIARSVEKPLYKEKLRVRWYGAQSPESRVFVEVKKKFAGIVYKRRVGCTQAAARAFLAGEASYAEACARFPLPDAGEQQEACAPRSRQIAREISQFLHAHGPLSPSMVIRCARVAYAPVGVIAAASEGVAVCAPAPIRGTGVDEAVQPGVALPPDVPADLRITFDSEVTYRDVAGAASPWDAHAHARLLTPGSALMEVKTSHPLPLWLVEALSGVSAYPSSFSKYGAAYEACEGERRALLKGGRCA